MKNLILISAFAILIAIFSSCNNQKQNELLAPKSSVDEQLLNVQLYEESYSSSVEIAMPEFLQRHPDFLGELNYVRIPRETLVSWISEDYNAIFTSWDLYGFLDPLDPDYLMIEEPVLYPILLKGEKVFVESIEECNLSPLFVTNFPTEYGWLELKPILQKYPLSIQENYSWGNLLVSNYESFLLSKGICNSFTVLEPAPKYLVSLEGGGEIFLFKANGSPWRTHQRVRYSQSIDWWDPGVYEPE